MGREYGLVYTDGIRVVPLAIHIPTFLVHEPIRQVYLDEDVVTSVLALDIVAVLAADNLVVQAVPRQLMVGYVQRPQGDTYDVIGLTILGRVSNNGIIE